MLRTVKLIFLFSVLLLASCYHPGRQTPDAWNLTERQLDSISFYTTHHYTQNFNFVVTSDTLRLVLQQPEEHPFLLQTDTLSVSRGDQLVVADVTIVPTDSVDSVWVKVARDQSTIGWVRECHLLSSVSPDDPLSRFIDLFSNTHLLVFLAILVLVAASYVIRRLLRRHSKLVHFNDIPTAYPMLLCLLIAFSATLYASIQLFGCESWRHFYYHPTLNPFGLPFHLGLFVTSVWAILIVGLAALDDVRRLLPLGEGVLYVLGLAGVCGMVYVVFSVSTLYYVGYLLLPVYVWLSLRAYWRSGRARYRCGRCGMPLQQKGCCPRCGSMNG